MFKIQSEMGLTGTGAVAGAWASLGEIYSSHIRIAWFFFNQPIIPELFQVRLNKLNKININLNLP